MDLTSYQEVKALFRPDWDAAILDILAQAPGRFTDLTRRIRRDVDVGIADGTLTRSLGRLQRHKLVRTVNNPDGNGSGHVYEITAIGCKKLATYHAILEAYQRAL